MKYEDTSDSGTAQELEPGAGGEVFLYVAFVLAVFFPLV